MKDNYATKIIPIKLYTPLRPLLLPKFEFHRGISKKLLTIKSVGLICSFNT